MADSNQAFSEELQALMPRLVERIGCDRWETMRKPLHCRDCNIYFLRSPDFRLPGLVVKIFHEDPAGRKKVKKLRAIHDRSSHLHEASTDECRVPEPVALFRNYRALAMEYVEAPMASSLLRSGFFSNGKKEDVIRKSAGWLQWFHAHSEVAIEPFEASRFNFRLTKAIEKIHQMNPEALAKKGFLHQCLAVAEKVATRMDGAMIHHASVHGDFTPFNLFIRDGRVTGFDYQENGRLPVSHDICRFLLYLDFTRILPANSGELKKFGCRKRNFDLFMEAYGANRELLDNGFWLESHFMELVRRITSLTMMQERGRSRPLRHIEMASLHRNARHMMTTLA